MDKPKKVSPCRGMSTEHKLVRVIIIYWDEEEKCVYVVEMRDRKWKLHSYPYRLFTGRCDIRYATNDIE